MNAPIAVLWRRLDTPGHDGCHFVKRENRWVLCGAAVFLEANQVCQLRYEVFADSAVRTREARVVGWLGENEVDLHVQASHTGGWTVNGVEQPQLAGCIDLDLGFTPATNFLPVQRLSLSIGEEADAPAAYLAFPRLRFEVLSQRYRRISDAEYEYEAPSEGYRDTLEITSQGVVADYPGLFLMEGR